MAAESTMTNENPSAYESACILLGMMEANSENTSSDYDEYNHILEVLRISEAKIRKAQKEAAEAKKALREAQNECQRLDEQLKEEKARFETKARDSAGKLREEKARFEAKARDSAGKLRKAQAEAAEANEARREAKHESFLQKIQTIEEHEAGMAQFRICEASRAKIQNENVKVLENHASELREILRKQQVRSQTDADAAAEELRKAQAKAAQANIHCDAAQKTCQRLYEQLNKEKAGFETKTRDSAGKLREEKARFQTKTRDSAEELRKAQAEAAEAKKALREAQNESLPVFLSCEAAQKSQRELERAFEEYAVQAQAKIVMLQKQLDEKTAAEDMAEKEQNIKACDPDVLLQTELKAVAMASRANTANEDDLEKDEFIHHLEKSHHEAGGAAQKSQRVADAVQGVGYLFSLLQTTVIQVSEEGAAAEDVTDEEDLFLPENQSQAKIVMLQKQLDEQNCIVHSLAETRDEFQKIELAHAGTFEACEALKAGKERLFHEYGEKLTQAQAQADAQVAVLQTQLAAAVTASQANEGDADKIKSAQKHYNVIED